MTGKDRHYPFPLPDWPHWRAQSLPDGLVDAVARTFPACGLPKLTDTDRLRLELVVQRFVYSHEWP